MDKRHPGLIERFGGHAMAAGLTLYRDGLESFRDAFAAEVRRAVGDSPAERELLSDGELPGGLLTLPAAEALRLAGPWGKGFAEPLFDGVFEISGARVVKEQHLKLRARAPGGLPIEAIGFFLAAHKAVLGQQARLAYRLDVNEYRGLRAPQLLLEHAEPAAGDG